MHIISCQYVDDSTNIKSYYNVAIILFSNHQNGKNEKDDY